MITFADIKNNAEIKALIANTENCLGVMKYTEHGERHASYVSRTSGKILEKLGYDGRMVELAYIAGYLHDVGNSINRHNHGITGAILVYSILKDMKMPYEEINIIVSAIGNHEEENGTPINAISAALIIADKSDAHRTRVKTDRYNPADIHDRVNFAIKKNIVEVDAEHRIVSSKFYMSDTSSAMEFFQIYLSRIVMSEKAAMLLNATFRLYINDVLINSPKYLK